jgi:transcriptional regulator with XRE-family HTH domain
MTFGEKLELALRRTKTTRAKFAELMGVGPNKVTSWTLDRSEPDADNMRKVMEWIHRNMGSKLFYEHDFLWLMRRRHGISLKDMAIRYGVSRVTAIHWERGERNWKRGLEWWMLHDTLMKFAKKSSPHMRRMARSSEEIMEKLNGGGEK